MILTNKAQKILRSGIYIRNYKKKPSKENIISFILHLDGVALTRSTHLEMWLFSALVVELPSNLRYRRYNMVLISIWVAYAEPDLCIWLKSIIAQDQYVKTQGIYLFTFN